MCKCKYPFKDKAKRGCDSLDLELPVDSKGFCIYHSEDILWKKKNNFSFYFQELIDRCSRDKIDFDCDGFILIDKGILKFEDIESCNLNFNDAIFNCGVSFHNCKLHNLSLERTQFKGDVSLSNMTVWGNTYFESAVFDENFNMRNCRFEEFVFLDNCLFNNSINRKGSDSTYISNVDFLGEVIFSNAHFFDALSFVKTKFAGLVDFTKVLIEGSFLCEDTIFDGDVYFIDAEFNKIKADSDFYSTVHFSGVSLNEDATLMFKGSEPFHNVIKNKLYLDFKETPKGKIIFQNFNLNVIDSKIKQSILDLEKIEVVEIRDGCRKYFCQTDIFEITTGNVNQKFILDITNVFCNFFEYQNGMNIGIEIVSKTKESIRYYYFTDEKISKDIFLDKIKQSECSLWNTFSNLTKNSAAIVPSSQLEIRNILIDLSVTFLKIGNVIESGIDYSKEDLRTLFYSVAPFGEKSIITDNILDKLSEFYHNHALMSQTIIMGNVENNITGNNNVIGDNNRVISNPVNISINQPDDSKESIDKIISMIEDLITKSEKDDAKELFEGFKKELSEQKPKKAMLKSLWDSLVKYLPEILKVANVTEKLVSKFDGII